eukprot:2451314-Rhodomonas_salina.1
MGEGLEEWGLVPGMLRYLPTRGLCDVRIWCCVRACYAMSGTKIACKSASDRRRQGDEAEDRQEDSPSTGARQ